MALAEASDPEPLAPIRDGAATLDTFERALFRLGAGSNAPPLPPMVTEAGEPQTTMPLPAASDSEGRSMREVAERLSTLRRQAEELARELQDIERELNR